MTTTKRIPKANFTVFSLYVYNDLISYHIDTNSHDTRIDMSEVQTLNGDEISSDQTRTKI